MEEGTDSVKIVRIEKTGEPLVSMRLGGGGMKRGFCVLFCVFLCVYIYVSRSLEVFCEYMCMSFSLCSCMYVCVCGGGGCAHV